MASSNSPISVVKSGPTRPFGKLLLAHGAGAPMDSDWMNDLCKALAEQKIQTIRFEFPYMQERRQSGKKRPPNRAKVLLDTWRQVIAENGPASKVFVAGKSMGGRMASHVADETGVQGYVALGFPFQAIGKPLGERHLQLEKIKTPTLIIQGTRDPMGNFETISPLKLSKKVNLLWMEDGDHSLKPRKSSGLTLDGHLKSAAVAIRVFMEKNKP